MDASSGLRPSRPMNVAEIAKLAESFVFQPFIPFKHYGRAAETLYQEAKFALGDGDIGKAYQMLWRHSTLVINHLPTHPEFKQPQSRAIFKTLFARQAEVVKLLEELKPAIDRDYKEWELMTASTRQAHDSQDLKHSSQKPSTYQEFAARDPSLRGNAKILNAAHHQELAVDLAQKEFRRRDAAKKATRQAGISEEEEQERRKAGSWDNWSGSTRRHVADDDDLQQQMEATRRRLDASDERRAEDTSNRIRGSIRQNLGSIPRTTSHTYHYPSISKSQPVRYDAVPLEPQRQLSTQPLKPPKELISPLRQADLPPPSRPDKELLPSYTPYNGLVSPEVTQYDIPELPPKEVIIQPPKKERLTFMPAAYLENGDPIRPVFLPSNLRQTFLDVAAENTRKGLEMCGMLCGRPVNNALFISCLLIPEQKCTPDTCETENESVMLDYCINEDLLMIGWIHTHPTQTCFMSSRDLHTQAGYQVMMPESIAIVCAPKHTPSHGIFRLTNPPGLTHILQCTHVDTFHQHSIDNIYTGAKNPPGHVYESEKLEFDVRDLRPK